MEYNSFRTPFVKDVEMLSFVQAHAHLETNKDHEQLAVSNKKVVYGTNGSKVNIWYDNIIQNNNYNTSVIIVVYPLDARASRGSRE